MKPRSVLLVEDDGGVLTALSRFFEERHWSVLRAATGARGIDHYAARRPDLVLLDLELPDMSGLPVLRRLRDMDGEARIIMLAGHADIGTAVEAIRLGADDFLTKPFELDHLAAVVEGQEEGTEARRWSRARDAEAPVMDGFGPSRAMRTIDEQVARIAAGDGPVLLRGEAGTEKPRVARRIHDRSHRRGQPFVEVDCSGIRTPLGAAELLGHEKGGLAEAGDYKEGLFEVADGGTIFLNDVGDLSPELQEALAKVLEHRTVRPLEGAREIPVDVRVMAATNRDLEARVQAGDFREDLYHRLNVLPLELPPLRERSGDDVAWLARRLLSELHGTVNGGPATIRDEALALMVDYDWPGNIREMRNVLERILILAADVDEIREEHLPAEIRSGTQAVESGEPLTLEEVERRHVARILRRTGGNRSQAARVLGISRAALYDKMDRFGLRAVGR